MRDNNQSDPLNKVFISKEEALAHWLSKMPEYLIPVFDREFMRRPKENDRDVEVTEQGGSA